MWIKRLHYHEFILNEKVQGSIKVNKNQYEVGSRRSKYDGLHKLYVC